MIEAASRIRMWALALGAALMAMPVYCHAAACQADLEFADQPAVGSLNAYGPATSIHYIAVPDLPGGSAIRVEIPKPSPTSHPWEIAVSAASTQEISKGDTILAAFWVRAEGGAGKISARLQGSDAPYTGIAELAPDVGTDWQLEVFQGVAPETLPANHANLTLSLNLQSQVLDVGPMAIVKNPCASADLRARLQGLQLPGAVDAMVELQDGVKLAVTLRLPAGKKRFPAVLQITGSGPWGRNPSDAIANALLQKGIAVAQFDKRGVGQSNGKYEPNGFQERVSDVQALVRWLRSQKQIDPRKTGLVGASEGAVIAYNVAARDKDVRFLVLLAPPSVPMWKLGIMQNELALRDAGASEEQIALNTAMLSAVSDVVQAGGPGDDIVAGVKRAITPYVGRVVTLQQADEFAESFRSEAYRTTYLYDPKADLLKIKAPVLALFGTLDHQVPSVQNAAALKAGLASDKDVTVQVLPGFNHLFQHAKIGNTAEWSQLSEAQASDPHLLNTISDWVSKHTAPPDRKGQSSTFPDPAHGN